MRTASPGPRVRVWPPCRVVSGQVGSGRAGPGRHNFPLGLVVNIGVWFICFLERFCEYNLVLRFYGYGYMNFLVFIQLLHVRW